MKKTWIIFLISIICGMIACSEDKDETAIPTEITGRWILEDINIRNLKTSDSDIKEAVIVVYDEFLEMFDSGLSIEFYDDGNVYFEEERMKYYGSSKSIVIEDLDGNEMNLSYSVSGSKLILTLDMKALIVDQMGGELDKDELAYLKKTLQEFTVDFVCSKL